MDLIVPILQQKGKELRCKTCDCEAFSDPILIRSRLTSNALSPVDFFSISCNFCGEIRLFNAQLIAGSILK